MAIDYSALFDLYNANDLVIIAGSELLRMRNEDLSFEQKVIERIDGKPYDLKTSPKTYSDLVIKKPGINNNQVKGIYNTFDQQDEFDVNLLQLIASLGKVKLFINTSYDTKLEKLLGAETEILMWNHKIKDPVYINRQNNKQKLFYLFGSVSEGISLFEEELIDCLTSLSSSNEINKSKTPEKYSFLEHLKDKTLVFIGNNFPDWFMRLMIRILYNAPVTVQSNKAYIINDKGSALNFETYFFEKYKIDLIHDFPIEEFLKKFHDEIWKQNEFEDWYKPKEVFISYDRTDSKIAEDLKNCLETKHVKVFFDIEDVGIAEHEKKITSRLQAKETCLVVCLLSNTLAQKTSAVSYVKRIEWATAEGRFNANEYLSGTGQKPSPFLIVPVAIDNSNTYMDKLPLFITKNNILPYNLQQVCDLIEAAIKQTDV